MSLKLPVPRSKSERDIEQNQRDIGAQLEQKLMRLSPYRQVPAGGVTGDVLTKIDARDYNMRWLTSPHVFNVRSYGAVGDGVADDRDAIQDALDAIVAANGGELYFPAGKYRVNTALTVDGQLAADPTNFSLVIRGEGRRATRLINFLAGGNMLKIGNASGTTQNGIAIYDIGFYADSSHTAASTDALLRIDYGLDARIFNCLFADGKGTLLYLGRPQNTRIIGTEFRGDSTNTNYGVYVSDAPSGSGQGLKLIGCTIRGCRGGTGIGVWLKNEGGGEHANISCMIEGNIIGVQLESSRHLVFDCSFENSVSTDTQVKVGVTAGVRAHRHTLKDCTFSASGNLDFKCVDAVLYNALRIEGCKFISTNGTNVYFGSDENNSPSYFINNDCDMTAVSFGGTDGKVIVYGNSTNGTNNPRTTAASLDTTPSVANFDILATANASATTITDFDDGHPGKLLIVMIEDANTTIANGTPIKTLSGGNITPANGDVLFFMAGVGSGSTNTPVWRQIPGLHATQTQAASSGTITVKSASANNANTTGWVQYAPGVWIPYSSNPAP